MRELARRYLAAAQEPVQAERRRLWRLKNSLKPVRPLIFVRAFAWGELPEARCECRHPLCRHYEDFFRKHLTRHSFGDDSVFEPWVTVRAQHACRGWGVSGERTQAAEAGGSWKMDYPIKEPEDIAKLRMPRHEIDEAATARRVEQVEELLGDIITVDVDRGPAYQVWSGDLSTDLHYLRGIEHFMLDMMDRPEWLHRLVAFMRDGVLRTHEQAERAGDWGLCNTQNQAMPYSEELEDPAANVRGVKRERLWCFLAAQEMTLISPEMHEEFVLRYQRPILAPFGLTAYGCCEDLTNKIDMLRSIPNLRRIAAAPACNVARCAEQIGADYVISYRPSPADMVAYGFDADRVRRILRRDLEACRGCHVDITLKDVQTVEGDTDRLRRWVQVTRDVIDEVSG